MREMREEMDEIPQPASSSASSQAPGPSNSTFMEETPQRQSQSIPTILSEKESSSPNEGSLLSSDRSLDNVINISSFSDEVFQDESRSNLVHDVPPEVHTLQGVQSAKKQLFGDPFRLVAYSSSDDERELSNSVNASKTPLLVHESDSSSEKPTSKEQFVSPTSGNQTSSPSKKSRRKKVPPKKSMARVCSHCGDKFASAYNRDRHEKRIHKGEFISKQITSSKQIPSSPAMTRSARVQQNTS